MQTNNVIKINNLRLGISEIKKQCPNYREK